MCSPPVPHKFLLGTQFLRAITVPENAGRQEPVPGAAWSVGSARSLSGPLATKDWFGVCLYAIWASLVSLQIGVQTKQQNPSRKHREDPRSKSVVWGLCDFEARKAEGTHAWALPYWLSQAQGCCLHCAGRLWGLGALSSPSRPWALPVEGGEGQGGGRQGVRLWGGQRTGMCSHRLTPPSATPVRQALGSGSAQTLPLHWQQGPGPSPLRLAVHMGKTPQRRGQRSSQGPGTRRQYNQASAPRLAGDEGLGREPRISPEGVCGVCGVTHIGVAVADAAPANADVLDAVIVLYTWL